MAQDQILQRILEYSSRNQGTGPSLAEKLERQDISDFLGKLETLPTDEGANPALSPLGQRWSHVERFMGGLTQPGAQWLEGQVREQLESDNKLRQATWDRLTAPPTTGTRRTAEWTRLWQAAGDPLGGMTLGWVHSPWARAKSRDAMQRGQEDAIIRILVDEERKAGTPEEEWLPRAFERLEKNDLPSGIKWAHRLSLIPELAYMLVPFGAAGKAASLALSPAKIGSRLATAGLKEGAAISGTRAFLGRTGEQIVHSAATFAGVEAASKPQPGDPNIIMRALHGARTGAVVGALGGPIAEGLGKVVPEWMQGGKRFWESHRLQRAILREPRKAMGVAEEFVGAVDPRKVQAYARTAGRSPFARVRAAGDGKNWVYRDSTGKEWKLDLSKRSRSTAEKVGRWLDVPGRASEASAFMGMTYTDGVRDSEELLFAGLLGAVMPDILGKPGRALRRFIPGTREHRDVWETRDLLKEAEETTSTQKNIALNEESAARRARQKAQVQDPGKTPEEAGRAGEIIPTEQGMGIVLKETATDLRVFDGNDVNIVPKEGAPASIPVQEITSPASIEQLVVMSRVAREAMNKAKKGNSNLNRRLENIRNYLEKAHPEAEVPSERGEGMTLEERAQQGLLRWEEMSQRMRDRITRDREKLWEDDELMTFSQREREHIHEDRQRRIDDQGDFREALMGPELTRARRVEIMRERFNDLWAEAELSKEDAELRKKYGLDKGKKRKVYQLGMSMEGLDTGAGRGEKVERPEDSVIDNPADLKLTQRVVSVTKVQGGREFVRRNGETEAQFEERKKKEGELQRRLPRPKSQRQKKLEKERGRPEKRPVGERRWAPTMQMELEYRQPAWRIVIMRGSTTPANRSPDPMGGRYLPTLHTEPGNWEAGQPFSYSKITTSAEVVAKARALMKESTGKPKAKGKPKALREAVAKQPEPTEEDLLGWPGKMNAGVREDIEDILTRIVRIRKYMEAPVDAGGFDPHVPDAIANRESLVRAEREWIDALNTYLGRSGGRMYTLEDYLRLPPEHLKGDPFVDLIRKHFQFWNAEAGMYDYKPAPNQEVKAQAFTTLQSVMTDEVWENIKKDITERAKVVGFEDMSPIFEAVAQREAMRTVAEWISTNTTPTRLETAQMVLESNVGRSVGDLIGMEYRFRTEHPEYPRPESNRVHVTRIKKDLGRKIRRRLEREVQAGEDVDAAQRDVMRYIEQNIDGEILRRVEESSEAFRGLNNEQRNAVFMLFMGRLSREMYPRGKVHPGTTYEAMAASGLAKKTKFAERPHAGMVFRTHPTQHEMETAIKRLKRHFEPHVAAMKAEWNSIWEGSKLGLKRGRTPTQWEGFAKLMRDHPIVTTLAAGAGIATIANAIASPTVGGSLLSAGLAATPLGVIAPGWFGTPRTQARLRSKQAGFLRSLRDTVEEPDALTTLQDLIRKGDLHGAKKTLAKYLSTPENSLGTPAIEPFMDAQIRIHQVNQMDRAHFFEGSNRHKAAFYGVKEGTALSKLLGRYLDHFRADNKGFPMGDKERNAKMKDELFGLDDAGKRIYSDEDVAAFRYAHRRVEKWLSRMRKELGKVFGIHIDKQEFGIDGYFPHIFRQLEGDVGWKEKIGSWFTSKDLNELPSVLNRRSSERGNYNPDAAMVMRVMAPAFRRIIELRRAVNAMEPFVYGQYENVGKYIDTVMKERHPTKQLTGKPGALLAKLQAVHTARDTESLRLLQEILAPVSQEQFHRGSTQTRTLGGSHVNLGIRLPGEKGEWFLDHGYRSGDETVKLRRGDIVFGERSGVLLKDIQQNKVEGYREMSTNDFLDNAKVRVNGLLQAGLTGRVELAEQFAKWAMGEKYSKFAHGLEKYLGGVAYLSTIGSFNPRPALHNLIGGQWLNFTELGMRYAMDGIRLASEVKAQPDSYYGKLLRRAGVMAEGTYMWQDMRSSMGVGKAWDKFQKFGYFWFAKTENFNRASSFLGGFQRAMDRMEIHHGKAKTREEGWRREEQAIREGKRAVNRTVAMYGAYNAPGLFRHPMGRLFMHLNRFSVLMFNRVVDMAGRAKSKKDLGRIFRLMAGAGFLYQIGTMFGQDLNFVFGQPLEDLGEPFSQAVGVPGGIGDVAPSMRAPSPEMWRLAVNPSETLRAWKEAPGGFIGDMIIPFALPYDWSPPVRIAMDMARFGMGAINDDAGVLQGFADRWSSEGQRTMELAIPFYGILKRMYQAGAAAGVPPMQELASSPGGWMKFKDRGEDYADESRFEVQGLRDRLSYRTSRENIFRRLLAPGIPIQTMRNIRDNQVDRSLGNIWMENRKLGWDRFLDSVVNGRLDEAREVLEVHDMADFRMQDMRRQLRMRNMPAWIRALSGPGRKKFELIARRWKEGNTPSLEIWEALNSHVSAATVRSLGGVCEMWRGASGNLAAWPHRNSKQVALAAAVLLDLDGGDLFVVVPPDTLERIKDELWRVDRVSSSGVAVTGLLLEWGSPTHSDRHSQLSIQPQLWPRQTGDGLDGGLLLLGLFGQVHVRVWLGDDAVAPLVVAGDPPQPHQPHQAPL
jgi:hypothetical protein